MQAPESSVAENFFDLIIWRQIRFSSECLEACGWVVVALVASPCLPHQRQALRLCWKHQPLRSCQQTPQI